jgi:hypothetical protein
MNNNLGVNCAMCGGRNARFLPTSALCQLCGTPVRHYFCVPFDKVLESNTLWWIEKTEGVILDRFPICNMLQMKGTWRSGFGRQSLSRLIGEGVRNDKGQGRRSGGGGRSDNSSHVKFGFRAKGFDQHRSFAITILYSNHSHYHSQFSAQVRILSFTDCRQSQRFFTVFGDSDSFGTLSCSLIRQMMSLKRGNALILTQSLLRRQMTTNRFCSFCVFLFALSSIHLRIQYSLYVKSRQNVLNWTIILALVHLVVFPHLFMTKTTQRIRNAAARSNNIFSLGFSQAIKIRFSQAIKISAGDFK